MPSTTRGSILISTANDIGEALVEKLGGVGYSPNEWKEKYNLCGIAPVDSAPALSVLADSAGTGDERGSILIATADAIGAILNKKYNVLRGFKPKEWASACRKMKALEEGSVASASIASFSDGADTVPLTSCVCSIDANLDGKTAVNAVHEGVNLFDKTAITENSIIGHGTGVISTNNSYFVSDYIPVKSGVTYYFTGFNYWYQSYYDANKNLSETAPTNTAKATIPNGVSYIRVSGQNTNIDTAQLEIGETASTYEAYKGETKTADLGRAVYGGSADIIKGEGKEICGKIVFDGSETRWAEYATGNGYAIPLTGMERGTWYTSPLALSYPLPKVPNNDNLGVRIGVNNDGIYVVQANTISGVTDLTSFKAWLSENPLTIIYPLDTEIDFTFEPVKIDSFPGVNNIWNDCGDTAVEYYQAPTPYARKTATGGIANFSDQRTDLPLTKAIANIAPSIAGKSAVNLIRAGKNLAKFVNGYGIAGNGTIEPTATRCATIEPIPIVKDTTYKVYVDNNRGLIVAVWSGNDLVRRTASISTGATLDTSGGDRFYLCIYGSAGVTCTVETDNPRCYPSTETDTTYEPYIDPTTYTAELGEAVYGGSVDFVSGEVAKEQDITTLTNDGWTYYATGGKNTFNKIISGAEAGEIGLLDGYTFEQVSYISQQSDKCFYFYASGASVRISIRDDAYTSAEEFAEHMNGEKLVYTLATPTESAIPGRVISPIEGVNNYWNDAGGDTEIQYFENEA